jgi:threonine dehydratase
LRDTIAALVAGDQVIAEGAGALAAAALRAGRLREDGRPIALVVSGGNIDADRLTELLARRERAAST